MAWGRDSFAEVTGECQCGSTDWLRRVRAVEGWREETCKCGFFKEMTRWTKTRTVVSLCSRERGGLVRSTLLCGEKGRKQGRRRRGGVLVEGGGEVEHVPDPEQPFGGRRLWLRLACGFAFQR